jgi:acyl-CoA synthetase (AMP-forming)/AMP-acid ligase II
MQIDGTTLERPSPPLNELLRAALRARPDEVALVSAERADLARARRGERPACRRLGLEAGDRLASLMPNRIDLVVHYLACFRAGLIATPLNYRYTFREIDHALEVSGAKALLAHVERVEDVAQSRLAGELELGTIAYCDDGSNISPLEVEAALGEHPAIDLAGVVGIHDTVHGENVRAYVTLREGTERPSSADLIVFCRERVGYKAPEEILFLDEMPLNPTGKIDRVGLKRMAEDHLHPHGL